jgi:hypothetical protein
LALPGSLVLCGGAALVTSILLTKKRNVALWKSSTLTLLFHGIPEDQWPKTSGGPATLNTVSDMQNMADGLTVELREVDGVTRLSLRTPPAKDEKIEP